MAISTNVDSRTIAQNEALAVGSMRTINTAEVVYASTYQGHGFAENLGLLGGSGSVASESGALLLDSVLGCASQPCTHNGYAFSITGGGGSPVLTFFAVAKPLPGQGKRTFCTDSSAVIRYASEGLDCTPASPPLQ